MVTKPIQPYYKGPTPINLVQPPLNVKSCKLVVISTTEIEQDKYMTKTRDKTFANILVGYRDDW